MERVREEEGKEKRRRDEREGRVKKESERKKR